MTNKNSTLMNKPFLLKPAGKDYLWGGDRLNTDFGKNIPMHPLAETWECSAHPDGQSKVDSGEHRGLSLGEVLEQHPEYLGTHPRAILQEHNDSFPTAPIRLPILIKLIDADQDLSVQVHPDDAYAQTYEQGALGKTELWYVLDAAPDAKLVHGFNRNMDPALLRRSLEQGEIEKYLQKIPVKKDDVFFIEPGTVHAIGAGSLIAEIQENSNITYRLYDYGRPDLTGKPRKLHVKKAMDTLTYQSGDRPRQPIRVLRYHPGCASELLCRCKYFQVERLLINTVRCGSALPDCSTSGNSFHVLLCIDGEGLLTEDPTQKQLPFFKGSCLFLPANSVPLKLQGTAQLLRVSC